MLDAKGAEETKLGRLEKGKDSVGRWGIFIMCGWGRASSHRNELWIVVTQRIHVRMIGTRYWTHQKLGY